MVGEVYDFRLIEVEVELGILGEQLEHIEEQIERGREAAELELAPDSSSDDEVEWHMRWQQYYHEAEVSLPRMWRNPFLVSMFSVYETAVRKVAELIQKKQDKQIGLDDLRGDFLERAKKYYKDVLQFKLSTNNERWKRLRILSDLRNVVAHTNGSLEMMHREKRKKILRYEGIEDHYDYLIVSGNFLRDTFALVRDELKDLVARYREWDTANSERR